VNLLLEIAARTDAATILNRAFLPSLPDIGQGPYRGLLGGTIMIDHCVLLTAAAGIGCSFMLLAVDMARNLDYGTAEPRNSSSPRRPWPA